MKRQSKRERCLRLADSDVPAFATGNFNCVDFGLLPAELSRFRYTVSPRISRSQIQCVPKHLHMYPTKATRHPNIAGLYQCLIRLPHQSAKYQDQSSRNADATTHLTN
ncbi:hypothetical protein PMIN06_000004 [Paraphaeosphaeria minitans]